MGLLLLALVLFALGLLVVASFLLLGGTLTLARGVGTHNPRKVGGGLLTLAVGLFLLTPWMGHPKKSPPRPSEPGPYTQRVQGSLQNCRTNLGVMARRLNEYRETRKKYPAHLADQGPIPTCEGQDTYSASYQATRDHFTVYCQGKHHVAAGAPPNEPSFHQ